MSEPPQRNRRLRRRYAPKRSTKAVCLKGGWGLGRNLALALLDLSETGARLLVREPLACGQEVEVSLEGALLPRPLKRLGAVTRCAPGEGGCCCIGVQFEKPLTLSELEALTTR